MAGGGVVVSERRGFGEGVGVGEGGWWYEKLVAMETPRGFLLPASVWRKGVCGGVSRRVCERVCAKVCGRVCGKMCGRVCGRVC